MVSASSYGNAGKSRTTHRRATIPDYDPLKERAKSLSDTLWERARNIAKVLAPDVPADAEQLDPKMQWMVLESIAVNLSPEAWDDPEAINDLYKLRKQFAPQLAFDWLPAAAAYRKKVRSTLPRPEITPANPEYAAMMRRLKRA